MKKVCAVVLFSVSCLQAVNVTSEFLRAKQTLEDASFPLELKGYLDLTFKVTVNDANSPDGQILMVERILDGQPTGSYTGYFEYGKPVQVSFDDGNPGPTITLGGPAKVSGQPVQEVVQRVAVHHKKKHH